VWRANENTSALGVSDTDRQVQLPLRAAGKGSFALPTFRSFCEQQAEARPVNPIRRSKTYTREGAEEPTLNLYRQYTTNDNHKKNKRHNTEALYPKSSALGYTKHFDFRDLKVV